MFTWAKQTLAHAVGTEEPIYGPSAIQSVAEQAKTTPHTEISKSDLKWEVMNSTSVESQIFYIMMDNGNLGFAQVIYSNVAGIRTTSQFNCKIFYRDGSQPHLWSTTQLEDYSFSQDKFNFHANSCSIDLSDDGKSYVVKSTADKQCHVDIKVTQQAPGFVGGKDGKSHFGTDPANPWGYLRHAFWPRCSVEGTFVTKDGPLDIKGRAFFVHALQGMKPHHAAAKWNFVNFQGPTYSAVMMEFITPPSYGTTSVPVGAIVKDGEIIIAGCSCSAKHTRTTKDADNNWLEPNEVLYRWSGTTKDGKAVEAVIETDLEQRLDRVDIMAEVPGFVKKMVAGTVGTKPYIYQYSPKAPLVLKLKIGDEDVSEEGILMSEATFLSEAELPGGARP